MYIDIFNTIFFYVSCLLFSLFSIIYLYHTMRDSDVNQLIDELINHCSCNKTKSCLLLILANRDHSAIESLIDLQNRYIVNNPIDDNYRRFHAKLWSLIDLLSS